MVNDGPEPLTCRVELPRITANMGELSIARPGDGSGLQHTRIDLAPTSEGVQGTFNLAPYAAAGLLCP